MTMTIKAVPAWKETGDTLVEALRLVWRVLEYADWSTDPDSPYGRATADEARLLDALKRHAALGVKAIDDAVAAGPLVAQIGALSKAAKHDADRLAAITARIDQIAGVVTAATGIVEKLAALAV